MSNDAPEFTGNRAARRAAARRGRKLTALGSGAVLATGVAASAMAAFAPAAGAVPIVVQNTNDSGAGSLREALANANPGDTIDLTGLTGTITLTSGELEIEDAVTITGPGASALSVSGNNATEVFKMNTDLSGGTVTISGITITGGNAGEGGGINFYCGSDEESGNLVVDNAVITGNTADGLGGGLYFDRCDDSNLTITNSVVSNNTSTDSGGGGIWFDEGNTLTIQNSTVANNNATFYGGGLYFDDGASLVVLNSTFSNNHASQGENAEPDEGSGGAMEINDITGTALIANSTITGNSAAVNGGGINLESGSLTLQQTTISGNTVNVGAGDGLYLGYAVEDDAAAAHTPRGKQGADVPGVSAAEVGTVEITGTIVAGNADGTDDIAAGPESGTAATIASSVIGVVNGVAVTDAGGNQMGVTDPGLDALASNGGATQTMALKPGSPAIDKGPDPVPTFPGNEFDQRGTGFARVVNGKVDVGAFEVQAPTPEPLVIQPKFTG